MTRRLTTLLQQAGLSAQHVVKLDQDNPWCGLFLDKTWTQGLCHSIGLAVAKDSDAIQMFRMILAE